jgi:hypothetical protein
MSAVDRLTILTAAGRDAGRLATKRITRDDGWHVEDYGNCTWWSARQIPVEDIVSLGRAIHSLEHEPHSCLIRGEPIEGVDLSCCRRLKDADPKDGTPPSFAPRARYYVGVDFDSVAAPVWDTDKLARRRAAIERNRAEHGYFHGGVKTEDDGEDYDFDGDLDPDPIDPVRDWSICLKAMVATLPPELHDTTCYYQQTSSAGIKPGVRMRAWWWLDRPITDAEAKRWFKRSPVDASLYGSVAVHYVAAPIFDPPELDPVPVRSGFWWRHRNTVPVPDLSERPKPKPHKAKANRKKDGTEQSDAERFMAGCVRSLRALPEGTGDARRRLIATARTLFGMARKGLLNKAEIERELHAAMHDRGWTQQGRYFSADEVQRHPNWASDRADETLPEGF